MRILVVQESDWIERGPHQNHHLFERLSNRGHMIRVIDFEILWRQRKSEGILSRRMEFADTRKATDDGRVTVIRPSILRFPVVVYLSLIFTHYKELRRQLKEFKPDVVIGFGVLNSVLSIHLCRRNEVVFLYYLIDELHRLVPELHFRPLARLLERWNLRNANAVISINETLREYAILMGAHKETSYVVPAGVDLERFKRPDTAREVRHEMGISDEDITLLFMGWLYDFSGLVELARAILRSESAKAFRLVIIGKGESLDELRTIKNEEDKNQRIILIDWVPYGEIPGLLHAADICVLPALNVDVMKNIVPIKIYEYMAAGKPVVATELPGLVREFGYDAGIIYVSDPSRVPEKVMELATGNMIKTQGKKARDSVCSNDWETIVSSFERVVHNAVDS